MAVSNDPVLAQAEKLINQQQPKSAFDLLAPLEDARAGDTDYDYLYGVAALESGQADRAAFAFERCLATDPKNGPCRVQMARVNLALGENQSAQREFKTIQEYNPPAEVQAMVSRYLGAISQQEKEARRYIGAWAQIGVGYDTNVNSASSTSQLAVALPGGLVLPFTINPSDRNQQNALAHLNAGANIRYNLNPAWSLLGDTTVDMRGYKELDNFNTGSIDVGLGAAYQSGPSQYTLKALGQKYSLDYEAYRTLSGGMAQYQYLVSKSAQLSAYLQAVHLDYDHQSAKNANRYTAGAAWSQAIQANLQPVLYAGLYGGQENTVDDRFKFLGQDFFGVRGGGTLLLVPGLQFNLSASVERRKFHADYPLAINTPAPVTRKETQYDATLGLIYALAPGFSLRPSYSYTNADSNIIINDYHRSVFSIDLRYEL
jgi:tetratricopeptide (TPR) repeat protein